MSDQDTYPVTEDELFELYRLLSDATSAAAGGNPNQCASKAADAREYVIEVRENAEERQDA